jgi:hypothetical protein
LLGALPRDSIWQQARNFCLQSDLDLHQSISFLQSSETETDTTTPTNAVGNTVQGRTGRRTGRGRGGRGRGRGIRNGHQVQNGRIDKRNKVCFFCGKKGHLQRTCYKYQEAQEACKDTDTRNTTDTSYSTVSVLTDTLNHKQWILDLAASEHVSGYKVDFSSIKPWNRLHTVEIANGELINIYGYGDIQIRTGSGLLLLKDV